MQLLRLTFILYLLILSAGNGFYFNWFPFPYAVVNNSFLFVLSGHFSLPALLFHLVSGVGLLTLTATIVDILALYILPDKLRYRRFVYEESPLIELKKNE